MSSHASADARLKFIRKELPGKYMKMVGDLYQFMGHHFGNMPVAQQQQCVDEMLLVVAWASIEAESDEPGF